MREVHSGDLQALAAGIKAWARLVNVQNARTNQGHRQTLPRLAAATGRTRTQPLTATLATLIFIANAHRTDTARTPYPVTTDPYLTCVICLTDRDVCNLRVT